jgi:hypothetical protein
VTKDMLRPLDSFFFELCASTGAQPPAHRVSTKVQDIAHGLRAGPLTITQRLSSYAQALSP